MFHYSEIQRWRKINLNHQAYVRIIQIYTVVISQTTLIPEHQTIVILYIWVMSALNITDDEFNIYTEVWRELQATWRFSDTH